MLFRLRRFELVKEFSGFEGSKLSLIISIIIYLLCSGLCSVAGFEFFETSGELN